MHGEVLHHLVRRGVQVASDAGNQETIYNIPTYALVAFGLTVGTFILLLSSVSFIITSQLRRRLICEKIRYTLWGVISTLAMVEEPQNTYLVREEKTTQGSDALAEDVIDTEVTVVKSKPVTGNIKATIKHLQSRAGFKSRWRGLSLFLVYGIAHSMLTGFLYNIVGSMTPYMPGSFLFARSLGSVLASIILARYSTAWVHIVISEPSAKSWYRRIPSVKAWKNVWAPSGMLRTLLYFTAN